MVCNTGTSTLRSVAFVLMRLPWLAALQAPIMWPSLSLWQTPWSLLALRTVQSSCVRVAQTTRGGPDSDPWPSRK